MLFQYLRKFEVAICRNRTTSVCLEENSIGNILQHSSHQISKQKWLELLEARWRVETKLLTACCHNHNWEACQWPNSKKARNIIYSFKIKTLLASKLFEYSGLYPESFVGGEGCMLNSSDCHMNLQGTN